VGLADEDDDEDDGDDDDDNDDDDDDDDDDNLQYASSVYPWRRMRRDERAPRPQRV
jgi:hypothetical protein